MKIIGIYDGRWTPPDPAEAGLLARFRRARWYKANPRGRDYMKALFTEYFGDGVFVDVAEPGDWRAALTEADEIVLLYPDAVGLGFARTERSILRLRRPIQDIRVLNGRRRSFRLDRATRRQLQWRRLLERWMLGELVCMPVFVGVALVLAAYDRLKAGGGKYD